jgi:DNA-binding MarR family transcriptional regulator
VDKTIHEPARLMILAYLSIVECADFIFLMNQTNLTQGNLSFHILKLEEAKYITVKKQFLGKRPHTMLSLSERGKKALQDYILAMKGLTDSLAG